MGGGCRDVSIVDSGYMLGDIGGGEGAISFVMARIFSLIFLNLLPLVQSGV